VRLCSPGLPIVLELAAELAAPKCDDGVGPAHYTCSARFVSYDMRVCCALSREILRSGYACATLRFVSSKEIKQYLAKLGKKGGRATAQKLTPEQRTASARKAAQARWAKQKGKFSRDTET
jgi:hypothetical protein